jgi:hypothetical protein
MEKNLWKNISRIILLYLNFIIKNRIVILLICVAIMFYYLYSNAYANHYSLNKYITQFPAKNNTDAWIWYNLVPNQCTPINLVIAAQYPSLSKFMGFVNPYTPLFADIASRGLAAGVSGAHGVTFETLTKFIYLAEVNPNIVLDNGDSDNSGLFQMVFQFNPKSSYKISDPIPPYSTATDNTLAYLNTGLAIIGTAAMFSDIRLKFNIIFCGISPMGIPTYTFRYKHFPKNLYFGTIAQEILDIVPEAVYYNGYYYLVDYSKLDIMCVLLY